MRKLFACILTFAMLISAVACAESIDLISMSLEQLIELRYLIDTRIDELIGRTPSTIAGGVYYAGQTIKPGVYVITCSEAYDDQGMTIQMFDSSLNYSTYINGVTANLRYSESLQPMQSVTISLSEGMVLLIHNGSGIIETIQADWAP